MEKLFHVLVIGGNMLMTGAVTAEPANVDNGFCDPADPAVCEINSEGKGVPKEGVVCCWGTSCEVASEK